MGVPKESVGSNGVQRVGRTVRVPKTAELIATQLRRQIIQGGLKEGEALPPEVQLMEKYGVSRPTLREAFRILETETLISVRRGARGGAQVTVPDPSVVARYVGLLLQIQGTTLEDVYEARMVSESACAAFLAQRRTKQDLADLRHQAEALREAVQAGEEAGPDQVGWLDLARQFHRLVAQRSGNKTLAVQCVVLQDIMASHLPDDSESELEGEKATKYFRRTLRSYTRLANLVEARDAEGARKHWENHMKAAVMPLYKSDAKSKPLVDLFS
ncbi:FadR/GntR family transcriptional regulator [Nocardiopsis nanhaiensis]